MPVDIPKSRAICEAATKGTGEPAGNKHWYDGGTDEIDGHRMFGIYRDGPDSVETVGYLYDHRDMQFSVAARDPETGWPAALDELEELRELAEVCWQIRMSTAGAEQLSGTPAEKMRETYRIITGDEDWV